MWILIGIGFLLLPACERSDDPARFPAAQPHARARPNIILVIADALRRDALPTYAGGKPHQSFWNELAAEGIVFDDAFAHSSKTFPAIPSLLASRVQFWRGEPIGEEWQDLVVDQENLMLAEAISAAGYETAAIASNPHQYVGSGWEQGFDHYDFLEPRDREAEDSPPYARGSEVNQAFLSWLDGRDSEQPFFAYVHYMDPHNPYWAPRTWRERFVHTPGRRGIYLNGAPSPENPVSDTDLQNLKEHYVAEIRYLDDQLRELRAALEERGLWETSIVIFTADHGDEFLEHGILGHGRSLNFGVIRVPLLIAGAGLPLDTLRGRRVDDLVRHIDIAPTVVELAGAPAPADFEGVSLLPLMRGETDEEARVSIAHVGSWVSVTNADWHGVWQFGDWQTWFFDRRADPDALSRIDIVPPHVRKGLRPEISAFMKEGKASREELARRRAATEREQSPPLPAEVGERLRALGYTE